MNQKTHKYTSGKSEERKLQKTGDLSNNNRAGSQKCSKKSVLRKFHKNHRKIPVVDSLSGLLQHKYLPVNFAKLLRTTFCEHLQWLLLSDLTKLKEKKNSINTKNESKTKQNTN